MDAEKILEQVEHYREIYSQLHLDKDLFPESRMLDSVEHGFSHCYALLDRIVSLVEEGNIAFAIQHLGFVQGCMWSHKLINFADLSICHEVCVTA